MRERKGYDEKLAAILRESAAIIAEKGYHQASIRDIAAATGISLSGLYYYFGSKEELLFLIQHHCFETLVEHLEEALDEVSDPEEGVRTAIRNHLAFFAHNTKEMKVLSHEAESLSGRYLAEVTAMKRRYTERVRGLLAELRPEWDEGDLRVATFALFGMMNWIYNWYRPSRDVETPRLSDDIARIFLEGYLSGPPGEAAIPAAEAGTGPSIWREP